MTIQKDVKKLGAAVAFGFSKYARVGNIF